MLLLCGLKSGNARILKKIGVALAIFQLLLSEHSQKKNIYLKLSALPSFKPAAGRWEARDSNLLPQKCWSLLRPLYYNGHNRCLLRWQSLLVTFTWNKRSATRFRGLLMLSRMAALIPDKRVSTCLLVPPKMPLQLYQTGETLEGRRTGESVEWQLY